MNREEKRFNIGYNITYKFRESVGGSYCYKGEEQGGNIGTVKDYLDYLPSKKCYKITVTTPGNGIYTMLESEFYEYDNIINLKRAREIIYE